MVKPVQAVCDECERERAVFLLVNGVCDICRLEAERGEGKKARARVGERRAAAMADLRGRRNVELEKWAWTVRPDSPLSAECQAEFMAWLKRLHRLTVDVKEKDVLEFVFPDPPALVYEPVE